MFDRNGARKYLNESERRAYFLAATARAELRHQAFCLVLYYTGCRISEGLNLTSERVDLIGKAIVFETMKRRKRGCFRSVPIPDNLMKILNQIVNPLQPQTHVWNFSRPTAYRLIKATMKNAGIAGTMASPKGLRHSFAVACVDKSVPLTTIQKWLGHARLETTAIYLEISGSEERKYAERIWL